MSEKVEFTYEQLHNIPMINFADPFSDIVDVIGPLDYAQRVSDEEIERYRGRLPDGLLRFWRDHGRGALLKGYVWVCDPEYRAEDFDVYMYEHDGSISAWSSKLHRCRIDLTGFESDVAIDGPDPLMDGDGNPMSDDLAVAQSIRTKGFTMSRNMDEQYSEYDLFSSASNRLGLLKPGEIFGFVPARQMGGEGYPEDMQKVKVIEHLLFQAELTRPTLIEWQRDPNNPANPLRRPVPVRELGPQG
ncbi:GAD-like domain-containing protein [Oryzifoliimicrobium ureilyticus]|uniref:GAD-like domain-containing protein n=1 Tax=Oryzifoliimicrobium ureilyticus TaxID=3113724 RepID=UPI00307638A0